MHLVENNLNIWIVVINRNASKDNNKNDLFTQFNISTTSKYLLENICWNHDEWYYMILWILNQRWNVVRGITTFLEVMKLYVIQYIANLRWSLW